MDRMEAEMAEMVEMEETERLPDEVNILKFAAGRGREIAAMAECVSNPCRTKLIFQSLPVHMRRRVMSHNPRRLPRRVRAAHLQQVFKSRGSIDSSTASRRRRRRPRNLLAEFARRQRESVWLETHVWHAKRFRMVKRWGRSLPEAPCDKAFRACYRAGSAHCLLQDVSYEGCVRLSGLMGTLKAGLAKITSPRCGPSLTAEAFVRGTREGSSYIFDVDSYPFGCAGKVSYLWRPSDDSNESTVWIFAHPSFYSQLIDILKRCFQLTETQNTASASTPNNKKRRNKDPTWRIAAENEKYFSNRQGVTLTELKDTINRFRLTGPLSHAILAEALRVPEIVDVKSSKKGSPSEEDNNGENHLVQRSYWEKMKAATSPAEFPSHIIIGLIVDDPRLRLPSKRTKATRRSGDLLSPRDLIDIPRGLSRSRLWDSSTRATLREAKIPNYVINKRRQTQCSVPGEEISNTSDIAKLPVILLQRPGSKNGHRKRLGYCCGWDIIIPGGFAMPFWLAFVLNGARTGGLRESTKLAFESGIHDVHPDTQAGRAEAKRVEVSLRDKYFRLPPNKRVNFAKFSIRSPFACPWHILLKDWSKETENFDNFFVLRDLAILKCLQQMIETQKIDKDIDWDMKCLVPVTLLTEGKGKISDLALICLLNQDDCLSSSLRAPVEPLQKDINQKYRKVQRDSHKTLLKRLRRRAVRRRKEILEKAKKYVAVPKQNNSVLIKKYLEEMQELWLPNKIENVRNQCSRETIGYVTKGEFSYSEARSSGLGYIALSCLRRIIETAKEKCHVFTRNIVSRQYRYATLKIICDL